MYCSFYGFFYVKEISSNFILSFGGGNMRVDSLEYVKIERQVPSLTEVRQHDFQK